MDGDAPTVSTLAHRVALVERALGIGPTKVAEILGVSLPTIHRYRNGTTSQPRRGVERKLGMLLMVLDADCDPAVLRSDEIADLAEHIAAYRALGESTSHFMPELGPGRGARLFELLRSYDRREDWQHVRELAPIVLDDTLEPIHRYEALNWGGVAELRLGRPGLARRYFEAARDLDDIPEKLRAYSYSNLGYLELKVGRPTVALAHLRRALKCWSDFLPARVNVLKHAVAVRQNVLEALTGLVEVEASMQNPDSWVAMELKEDPDLEALWHHPQVGKVLPWAAGSSTSSTPSRFDAVTKTVSACLFFVICAAASPTEAPAMTASPHESTWTDRAAEVATHADRDVGEEAGIPPIVQTDGN